MSDHKNLYAIVPSYAPMIEITWIIGTEKDALDHAVFVAAHDLVHPEYGSPSADVYLVAENVRQVGTSFASDAPASWEWAHPAVEEALASAEVDEASWRIEYGRP